MKEVESGDLAQRLKENRITKLGIEIEGQSGCPLSDTMRETVRALVRGNYPEFPEIFRNEQQRDEDAAILSGHLPCISVKSEPLS